MESLLLNHPWISSLLKKDRQAIYKKDGTFRKSEHVAEQRETLRLLKLQGYMAVFACGFEEAQNIVDYYMKIKKKY